MPGRSSGPGDGLRWLAVLCALAPACHARADRPNRLGEQEVKEGFKLLFDGNSMAEWRNYKSETVRPEWQIIDGTMVLTKKGGRDLVTKAKFGHFDLRLEYAIAEKGNSGVLFRVVEETEERNAWPSAASGYASWTGRPPEHQARRARAGTRRPSRRHACLPAEALGDVPAAGRIRPVPGGLCY